MSKKDYEAVAESLNDLARENPEYIWLLEDVAKAMADIFTRENDRFDRSRFLYACGV